MRVPHPMHPAGLPGAGRLRPAAPRSNGRAKRRKRRTKHNELRDAIQQPIDKAKAANEPNVQADKEREKALEGQGGRRRGLEPGDAQSEIAEAVRDGAHRVGALARLQPGQVALHALAGSRPSSAGSGPKLRTSAARRALRLMSRNIWSKADSGFST